MTRSDRPAELARLIGVLASDLGVQVAVVESLTGGLLSAALAEAPRASSWYAGGIIAYARHVKHDVLEVPPGPVVSPQAALAMATQGAKLLSAEYAVSLTGVGGPDPQDGQPPGTVYVGLCTPHGATQRRVLLPGPAHEVCRSAVRVALADLERELATEVAIRATLLTVPSMRAS
ncbi:MAG TPA: CinA family protein [Sporichthya sp.]|nr:CinA family protein [Sporichthya sp.]